MNLCFLIGKIISEIEFNFIICNGSISEEVSIAEFKLELENKTIVKIIAYKELADKCYRELVKEKVLGVFGSLNTCGEIEMQELYFGTGSKNSFFDI